MRTWILYDDDHAEPISVSFDSEHKFPCSGDLHGNFGLAVHSCGGQIDHFADICRGCGACFPQRPRSVEGARRWHEFVSPADGDHEWGRPELAAMLAEDPATGFKLVSQDGSSPFAKSWGGEPIRYEVGRTYEEPLDASVTEPCARGLAVGTLGWCLRNWSQGLRILEVSFSPRDAVVPSPSDGKIRVRMLSVVREREGLVPCEACLRSGQKTAQ